MPLLEALPKGFKNWLKTTLKRHHSMGLYFLTRDRVTFGDSFCSIEDLQGFLDRRPTPCLKI